jgi:outer membrane protein OmpA-like peptidoglycan-associated protein
MMKDLVLGALFLIVTVGLTAFWELSARTRLAEAEVVEKSEPAVAVAEASDVEYCTANLKKILRRVLQSCGLVTTGETRGCQPLDAKKVATMSGEDFNALFLPLAKRAGIIEFDQSSSDLDQDDNRLLDRIFANQQGASYFFVVARASPEGSQVYNRDLSQARGEAVLQHLQATFQDPDLDKEVGLLWLGEEYAQLDEQFCGWQRSGPTECNPQDLNRSAFVAWIDCQL